MINTADRPIAYLLNGGLAKALMFPPEDEQMLATKVTGLTVSWPAPILG